MKIGRLSQTNLNKALLNIIKYKGEHSCHSPKTEDPCVQLHIKNGDVVISSMASVSGNHKDLGVYGIIRAIHDIICRHGKVTGIHAMIHLPEHAGEMHLKTMVQAMEDYCTKVEVPLLNVQVIVSATITMPQVVVTSLGESDKENFGTIYKGEPYTDILMVGEVGLEGALRLLGEKRKELEKRFNPTFLRGLEAKNEELIQSIKVIQALEKSGAKVIHQVPESGILGGLWELGEAAGLGMKVLLKNLPISQEVIEICEYLGVNPYRLCAAGTLLVLCHNGEELAAEMEVSGFKVSVIGKMIAGNERTLCNKDDIRHLERPTANELYKLV